MTRIVGEVKGVMKLGSINENAYLLQGNEILRFNETILHNLPSAPNIKYYPFRQLSKTIVGKGTSNASDFSVGNILQESLPLMERIPACFNHNYKSIEDIKGTVVRPFWQESYEHNGKIIPAGINAYFAFDTNLGEDVEKICKLLDSPVSPKIGASTTVYFNYKASHDLTKKQFQELLGTIGKDGQMVRRIPTKIRKFKENSLVFSQADEFALRQDKDGKIQFSEADPLTDPELVSFQVQEEDLLEIGKFFSVEKPDYNISYFEIGTNQTANMSKTENPPGTTPISLGESTVSFQDAFGVQRFEELTQETFEKTFANNVLLSLQDFKDLKGKAELHETTLEQFAEVKATKEKVEKQLETQMASFKDLQKEQVGLQATIKTQEKELEQLRSFSNEYRSTVEKAYRLSLQDKPADEKILDKIQNSTLDEVGSLAGLFGVSLNEVFGLKCQSCNSNNVQFGSAQGTQKAETNSKTNARTSRAEKIRSKYNTKKQ